MFLAVERECLPNVVSTGFAWCVPGTAGGDEGSCVAVVASSPIILDRVAIFTMLGFLRGAFRLECVWGFVGLSASTHPRNRSCVASAGLVHAIIFMWGSSVIEGGDPHAGRPLIPPRGLSTWGVRDS
jgi:hypothetical protein